MIWESLHMRSDHNLVLVSEWRVGKKIKELTLQKPYIKF